MVQLNRRNTTNNKQKKAVKRGAARKDLENKDTAPFRDPTITERLCTTWTKAEQGPQKY
jgi:hypothetical protein